MWRFSKCNICGNKTKSFWTFVGVNNDKGTLEYFAALSEDFKKGYRISNWSQPVEYTDKGQYTNAIINPEDISYLKNTIIIEVCEACKAINFYDANTKQKLYPQTSAVVDPNPDMPEKIKEIYNEARLVIVNSTRAALALNRLALDLLCDEVGAKGHNLNEKIKDLGQKGILEPELVRIAHGVRGLGNGAVHPRNIDEQASKEDAEVVFELLNLITEETLTRKKRISNFSEKYGKDSN